MGSGIKGPRRSSAAQTDISALPNHWRSDTHLAKKALPSSVLTTLPSKVSRGMGLTRLAPPVPIRPTHLSQESRRVLLSDIGIDFLNNILIIIFRFFSIIVSLD